MYTYIMCTRMSCIRFILYTVSARGDLYNCSSYYGRVQYTRCTDDFFFFSFFVLYILLSNGVVQCFFHGLSLMRSYKHVLLRREKK